MNLKHNNNSDADVRLLRRKSTLDLEKCMKELETMLEPTAITDESIPSMESVAVSYRSQSAQYGQKRSTHKD